MTMSRSIFDNGIDFNFDLVLNIPSDYLGLQIPPTIESIEENSRASFPLALNHSSYYVKPRMALIG